MLPWLLILPSLVLAFGVIGYPFYEIARLSVSDVSRFGQLRGFVGFANFASIATDPIFVAALVRTLVWTVAVVGGTILLSVPVALVLNQDFAGRGLARIIVMLPWSIALSMAAIVWMWAFNADYGMINATLRQWGIIGQSVQWLARPETAFPVEVGVGIVVSIPFTTTIVLGGLSSISGEIYEAARIDGAGPWQGFWHMTLPMLGPFLNIAIVLNVIHVFSSFPIIWVMTQGGPDNSTHILVTYLYELSFYLGRPGPAAAVSLVMLVIVFGATALYMRLRARDGI
ncbi:MAG TPA: sugar ABC transporter permease [Acetobacteraceae bacterium]|jgi:multiple sugar transport system permease protein|nr:sugar ABC transporter permease [Acetobacteraceae bacterium]